MTPFPWFDVAIIIVLILINGLFAMSELAIVSARKSKLQTLTDDGSKGAAIALRLAADPGKFLSTVQIGITLIGIIAGAYSGASLGGPVAERLAAMGMDPDWSVQYWLRAGDRPHHLCLTGYRRAGAEAICSPVFGENRRDDGSGDGPDGPRRGSAGLDTGRNKFLDFPTAGPAPEQDTCRDRRRAADGVR